jgi:hypothetical protein
MKVGDIIESIDEKPSGKSVEEVSPAFRGVNRALIEPHWAFIGPS